MRKCFVPVCEYYIEADFSCGRKIEKPSSELSVMTTQKKVSIVI